VAAEGKRYYRIGEVARITQVKPYVLRYWESEFRWMAPAKSRSNQRMYRQRDIDTILLIKKLLYEERYTIKGARQRLRELGRIPSEERAAAAPPEPVALAPAEAAGARSDEPANAALRRIRDELVAIRALL
jgi:DNA-binding transcriptional MerR regulator